jgi:hypothetical protein
MPLIVAALVGALIQAAVTMVGRVLIALAISAVTYAGVSALFNQIKASAFASMDSAFAVGTIGQWMGILHVGACMNILFSAVAARLVLKGLTNGSLKRWVTK